VLKFKRKFRRLKVKDIFSSSRASTATSITLLQTTLQGVLTWHNKRTAWIWKLVTSKKTLCLFSSVFTFIRYTQLKVPF